MLNVGGSSPRQGPLVCGLTIALNKCHPLPRGNQWLPMLSTGTKSGWQLPAQGALCPRADNCISVLCTNLLGPPPPPAPRDLVPQNGEKHINTAQNLLYIAWVVFFGDGKIIKTNFKIFSF